MLRTFAAGIALAGSVLITQASAELSARLDHNGSQMTYTLIGDHVIIKYAEPRAGLGVTGITAGTTLFDGRLKSDEAIRGIAYTFARNCVPAPYEMHGTLDAQTIVLEGAAPVRGLNNCVITGYRIDRSNSRLAFRFIDNAAVTNRGPDLSKVTGSNAALAEAPIVLDWMPDVGGPEHTGVPDSQYLNEAMPRHIYLTRIRDDARELHIAWRVGPDENDPYPAKPNLFGSDTYPSGQITMMPGQRNADIVIRTVSTKTPDWHRGFQVALTNADNGQPVLSTNNVPISVGFEVMGDLKCAPGHPDLCDAENHVGEGEDNPEAFTDTTSAELAGFQLPEFMRMEDSDQSDTARLIRRELLPSISKSLKDAPGLSYLWVDIFGNGQQQLFLTIRHVAACRPECLARLYAFDGKSLRQRFEVRASSLAIKPGRPVNFPAELAALHDTKNGTITDFFRMKNGQFQLYRRDTPTRKGAQR